MGTASLVFNAISGSTKLLVKVYLAMRRGKKNVKKAKKTMHKFLIKSGLPKDVAIEIAECYTSTGKEILSIRKMISLAKTLD